MPIDDTVEVLLRPGRTPSVSRYPPALAKHAATIRGDGHYGRGNAALSRLVEVAANDVRVCRAEAQEVPVRRYTETCYGAKSRGRERRVAATAEFATLRMRLLKIAARSTETATRVRVAFAAACPDAALFRGIAVSFQPAGP